MAESSFLNANAHRAYPFLDVASGASLPEASVVDFGCMVGLNSGWDDETSTVYLHRVRRSGDVYRFEFRSDAPGLQGWGLIFDRNINEAENTTSWEDAVAVGSGSVSSESVQCADDPIWEGFLTIGSLADLADLLADGESLSGPFTVEPARIQNLDRTYVRSFNLINADRTHIEAAPDCSLDAPNGDQDRLYVQTRCISGQVKFKEGFNCSIRQNAQENSLVISASVGAGAGQPCEEVPLYVQEAPANGSPFLSGGPSCNEVLKTINGVPGPVIRLYTGTGIRAVPGSEEGVLIIRADLKDLAICRTSSLAL